jgi:hypothetical protein
MTIANCPRCSEQVSVPDGASHEATVRCPLCRDEYSLSEALAQLPPSLIVVSDFGEEPATAVADEEGSPWAALNLDDDDADEVSLAPMDDASPAAAFDFASGSAPTSGKPTAASRSSSQSRKPKGSPIKSVLSIVIGGLLAFPIAQLILWYLPGDWKRDFGAGPIVAQYVPQIVPAKFRGSSANDESNSGPATQDSGSVIPDFSFGGGEFTEAGTSGGGNASNDNKKTNRPNRKKQNTDDAVSSNSEPPAEEQMSLEDAAAAGADVFGSPLEVPGLELGGLPLIDEPASPSELPNAIARATEEPASQPPSSDDTPLVTEPPGPAVSSLAPGNIRNAPRVSADDVVQSVQAAASGNLAWDNSEASSPSSTLKREFYLAFSKLGEALTFADRSDENVATQIAETAKILHEVSQQSDKLDVIGGVANGWIAAGRERRTTDGICLYGVVTSVESIGDFFETTVESAGKQIAVVSTTDPSEYFAMDRQVLILGTILDDPAKNLGGYQGSRSVVVLDGYHVNMSAE